MKLVTVIASAALLVLSACAPQGTSGTGEPDQGMQCCQMMNKSGTAMKGDGKCCCCKKMCPIKAGSKGKTSKKSCCCSGSSMKDANSTHDKKITIRK